MSSPRTPRVLFALALLLQLGYPSAAGAQPARLQKEDSTEAGRLARRVEELADVLEYAAAIEHSTRLLSLRERELGAQHPQTIKALTRLALLHAAKHDHARAEELLRKALAEGEKAGPEGPAALAALEAYADWHLSREQYAQAEPHLKRALVIREKESEPNLTELGRLLSKLASAAVAGGRYDAAKVFCERALAAYEKSLGPEHPETAVALIDLASVPGQGEDESNRLVERAERVLKRAAEAGNPEALEHLHSLAERAESAGSFNLARIYYLLTLSLARRLPGSERMFEIALNNLAEMYRRRGRHAEAEPLFLAALDIAQRIEGQSRMMSAVTLNNLGLSYKEAGEYEKAEPLYLRALATYERSPSASAEDLVRLLNNLAKLYFARGDYARAIRMFERARAMVEKHPGFDPAIRRSFLTHLAALYEATGAPGKAERIFKEAGKEAESIGGISEELFDIVSLFLEHRAPAKAERVLDRALDITEGRGPPHDIITGLHSIATVYRVMGNYSWAESYYEEALEFSRAGSEDIGEFANPDESIILNELAVLYHATGRTAQAITALEDSRSISESNLWQTSWLGDPSDPVSFGESGLSYETNIILSVRPRDTRNAAKANRLALETLLLRKGRYLDSLSYRLRLLQRSRTPEAAALLKELRLLHARLASAVLGGGAGADPFLRQARVIELAIAVAQAESKVGSVVTDAVPDPDPGPVSVASVRKRIPADAALVEFAVYRPVGPKHVGGHKVSSPPRYVAFVLHGSGPPRRVELGDGAKIDRAVSDFRAALRDPGRGDVKTLGRRLDEMVMRPVRAQLGGRRSVFVSPDGALNLIPFAPLVDERGRFLVDEYSFTYLSSGRDLLGTRRGEASRQNSLIVADPDFGERPPAGPDVDERAADLSRAYFKRLPGTAEEASAIKDLLPGATVLVGKDATESSVKGVQGPRVLHIATHGFFLDEGPEGPDARVAGGADPVRELAHEIRGRPTLSVENLLLKSGLGLAGANLRGGGEDDGLLTALEVSDLDLSGTQLVVLSACDTGVGTVFNGDGVYGLRRALMLAGAESQLISLWPVSDRRTKDLMQAYYTALREGQGRGEALVQVQRRLSASPETAHPFYWASFILSGQRGVMDAAR